MHELSKRLTDRFRVIVLCPHAPGARVREMLDGVEVVRYRYAPDRWETLVNDGGIVGNLRKSHWKYLLVPGFVLVQAWHAWMLLWRENVAIIHAHWLVPQGVIAALLRNTPFLVTAHGSDIKALNGRVMDALRQFVIRRSSAIAVVSNMLRNELAASERDGTKIQVLPMGVDLRGRFVLDESVERSNSEILFVGRLVEGKGLDRLLDAMPEVLKLVPDAKLTVAGHGPMLLELEERVVRLGITGSVNFIGAVAQHSLPALYRRAALFVAPFGKQEGLGLVIVEAIGCGCPVLVGDAPAAMDILGDSWEKHAVDPLDVTALSSRIVAALSAPHMMREQLLRLRESVVERFDWIGVAERYSRLLVQSTTSRVQ